MKRHVKLIDELRCAWCNKPIEGYHFALVVVGKVRAQRFMRDVDEMFDSINKGYLRLDDVLETVEKELGIAIIPEVRC